MKKIISNSIRETDQIAAEFAEKLTGGEVFGLVGNLGSGKTTFVQGIAHVLEIKEKVTSPTFVILKEYQTNKDFSLVHADLYRIDSLADAESAGLFDYLGKSDKICFIEWADKIKNDLPKKTKFIKFKFLNKNTRAIVI